MLEHGEAVAIGVALDSASALMVISPGRGRAHLSPRDLGFDLRHDALRSRDDGGRLAVLRGLREFQEHLGGEPTVTLLAAIGRASTFTHSTSAHRAVDRMAVRIAGVRTEEIGCGLKGSRTRFSSPIAQHPRGRVLGRLPRASTRTFRTIKGAVSPDAPFGPDFGYWPRRCGTPGSARRIPRAQLERLGAYVFTINAFPFGPFHGTRVKEGGVSARLMEHRSPRLHARRGAGPRGTAAARVLRQHLDRPAPSSPRGRAAHREPSISWSRTSSGRLSISSGSNARRAARSRWRPSPSRAAF